MRYIEQERNSFWAGVCKPVFEGNGSDAEKTATVMKLLLSVLDLHEMGGYQSKVKERFPIPRLFVLSLGLDKSVAGTPDPNAGEMFSHVLWCYFLYWIHQSMSQLLYLFRVIFLSGMYIKCDEQNAMLRNVLSDVSKLSRSHIIMSLAEMAAICKRFEKLMPTGLSPTSVEYDQDGNIRLITKRRDGTGNVILKQSQIQLGIRKLFDESCNLLSSIFTDILSTTEFYQAMNIAAPPGMEESRVLSIIFNGRIEIKKACAYNVSRTQ